MLLNPSNDNDGSFVFGTRVLAAKNVIQRAAVCHGDDPEGSAQLEACFIHQYLRQEVGKERSPVNASVTCAGLSAQRGSTDPGRP